MLMLHLSNDCETFENMSVMAVLHSSGLGIFMGYMTYFRSADVD